MIIVAGVVVDHAALVCVLAAVVLMLALRYHVAVSLADLRRSPTKSSLNNLRYLGLGSSG